QERDKSTIWLAVAKPIFDSETLLRMKELGFNPNWTDSVNSHTFLFSEEAWRGKDVGFDINHKDVHGDNALEYHCRHLYKKRSCKAMEPLAEMGIKLSDKFPNIQKCRDIFPDNPYLQALLGTLLLYPNKSTMNAILYSIPMGDSSHAFKAAIRNDPD